MRLESKDRRHNMVNNFAYVKLGANFAKLKIDQALIPDFLKAVGSRFFTIASTFRQTNPGSGRFVGKHR